MVRSLFPAKLFFVINVDWFFLSHRLNVAKAAHKSGYSVHLVCNITDPNWISSYPWITVHHVPFDRSGRNIFFSIYSLFRLYYILVRHSPDIIHAVTLQPIMFVGLISKIKHLSPIVYAFAGLGFLRKESDSFLLLYAKQLLLSFLSSDAPNCFILQNKSDYHYITSRVSAPASSFYILPGSGIDLSQYATHVPVTAPYTILMASRILRSKGILEYIASSKLVHLTHPSVSFLLAGKLDPDNPDSITRDELLQLCKGYVQYIGFISNITQLLQTCSVFVLPSYYSEGLPRVLCEAQASGRPVVTTNHPGCADAIIPNVTGLLVPVKDHNSLACSLRQLLDNPDLLLQMGRKARQHAFLTFSAQNIAASHLSIYKSLLC